MSDTTFTSKSSVEVKIISALSIVLLATIIGSVFFMNVSGLALLTRIIIVGLVCMASIYFFSISLKRIIISNDSLILYKNIGREHIKLQTVTGMELIAFSNLTTTFGSKGFFGYNGQLMDDSKTLVNDRRKMVKIYTPDKNYIISCDDPQRLVSEIEYRRSN